MLLCASPLASPIYTIMHILSNKNVGICPFATPPEHNLTGFATKDLCKNRANLRDF